MARQSECEHDIGIYRIIGGSGLDVTEECSECGTRITNESPKTKFNREKQEEKKQAKGTLYLGTKNKKEIEKVKESIKSDKPWAVTKDTKVEFTEKDDKDFWVKEPKGADSKKVKGSKKYSY